MPVFIICIEHTEGRQHSVKRMNVIVLDELVGQKEQPQSYQLSQKDIVLPHSRFEETP